ncbi:MAG: hypothetical protein H0U85_10115 [Gemmatimonadales bacterium]|nr:hypothetical protein [Gemmatimonadales bacterium]
MRLLRGLALLTVAGCSQGRAGAPAPESVQRLEQVSGTSTLLQAVSPVDERIVWVSGHAGTYARTLDGGTTWHAGRVPGDTTLQFRDVYAADANTAWLMSAGNGDKSKIFRTTDGGQSWTLQFTNTEPRAFYDCMDFWDPLHGIAMSDEVDGRTPILMTTDGGAHWTLSPTAPAAQPGEGGFAASGTCLITRPGGHAFIATGNGARARLLHSRDYGMTWSADTLPLASGSGIGSTSAAFRDLINGAVLGGNVGDNAGRTDNVAVTQDGGRTWRNGARPPFAGAVFGSAYVPGARHPALIAAGPRGLAWSADDGASWVPVDTLAYWAVGAASPNAAWAVGPRGRITRLSGFPAR